jgi:long-chain acyl-CoA synthetase
LNLAMLLDMAASAFGERPAVQHEDDRLSYAELRAAAGRAAADLRARGVERLALLDLNSPAVPVGLFAAAWAGIPFAPLSYRLRDAEIAALLGTLAPALLVTDAERARTLRLPEGVRAVSREAFLAHARGAAPAPAADWPMEPEAIAVLLFTSGTTGAPKAAVLRHKHLVSYVLGSVEFGAAGEQDATLVSVPPYHVAGMAAIASSIYSGRRLVQLASFAPDAWLAAARRERVSHAFVVPTMLARIVDQLAEGEGGLALRALAYGGGKMPLGVIERAMQLLPETAFTNAYGLTETSSTLTVLGPEEHRSAAASADPAVRRRLASVGRALPSVELEIRDEDGKPLGPGERGEIHVRGEQVSGEYLGRPSTLTADGWFPTRDAGWLDEEGYLFLDGRIDDVIVRGGENLSPGEIEEVLLDHPAVADVAVVGVPDEEWGEAVAAAVVLRAGAGASADELRAWVRERLRSNRMPSRIEFRAELPYNESGKLLRRQVRAELAGAGS